MEYSPYNEVLEIVKNRQLHNAVHDADSFTAPIVARLPEYKDLKQLEERWRRQGLLGFDKIFSEPLGFYLIKQFLIEDYSVDKALFISDVKVYKKIEEQRLRKNIGKMIYRRYCWYESDKKEDEDVSEDRSKPLVRISCLERHSVLEGMNRQGYKKSQFIQDLCKDSISGTSELHAPELLQENSNCIGVHGHILKRVQTQVSQDKWHADLFDELMFQVRVDLRLDVYPRFLKSKQYRLYIKFKTLENELPSVKDFKFLRCLGRGAFGFVNAAVKKDSGVVYAMKIIEKTQLNSIKSVLSNMSERNCLAKMDSRFVVCLKYAMMDHKRLFYVLDLCSGGDMKFHLSNLGKFPPHKVKFYAAEILLGLEHIHKANIIYRDMKLENILLELSGHAKISDLGLGVILDESHDGKVKGYAGTPGYTAPEIVMNQRYGKEVDLFSFGVLIYRMISATKPWTLPKNVKKNQISAVDSAVVNMKPSFDVDVFEEDAIDFLKGLLQKTPERRLGYHSIEEVKNHKYFEGIHFGLVEGGFIDPPFSPSQSTNVETLRHISRLNNSGRDSPSNRKNSQGYEDFLADFPFYSAKTWQREIVKMLKTSSQDDMKDMGINWPRILWEVLVLFSLQVFFIRDQWFNGYKVMYKKYLVVCAFYLLYMGSFGWSESFHRFALFDDPIWKLSPEHRIYEFTNSAVYPSIQRLMSYETYNTINQSPANADPDGMIIEDYEEEVESTANDEMYQKSRLLRTKRERKKMSGGPLRPSDLQNCPQIFIYYLYSKQT